MINNLEDESENQQIAGDRLNKILDQAGFKRIRGRSADLFDFLNKHCPDEWDLKASTVRSWFHKSAPPMKKIVTIIELLDEYYGFKGNPELKTLQGWWKIGGDDPFENIVAPVSEREDVRKLEFLLPSIILEQIGDKFSDFRSAELEEVREFTMNFALAFSDPELTKCPDKYLKMAINHALAQIQNKK
jgi:hypothetical protein